MVPADVAGWWLSCRPRRNLGSPSCLRWWIQERRSPKLRLLAHLFSLAVRTLIWKLDEDKRAIQGGRVISVVLSAIWVTSLIGTYACAAIVALVFCDGRIFHRVRRKQRGPAGTARFLKWQRNWDRKQSPNSTSIRRLRRAALYLMLQLIATSVWDQQSVL